MDVAPSCAKARGRLGFREVAGLARLAARPIRGEDRHSKQARKKLELSGSTVQEIF